MTLKELEIGKTGKITEVGGEGELRQHFLDMGVIPGALVTVTKYAPMGDPIELLIHGYSLTLRLDDAKKISISTENIEDNKKANSLLEEDYEDDNKEHPGLGEGGKYHPKGSGTPIPEGETLTFALIGNQNCGKTTLFNQLTGSNQHVGNFPGVTVDRKDGVIKGHPNTLVTDLPGIYSMSPYSHEEIVSRDFVLNEKPKALINIIDATNIERNLYLTMQLLEMNIPMVVALNMMDEVAENGGTIDINRMEAMLGIPVVPISAAKKEGIHELIEHAIHVAKYQEKPVRQDFCDEEDHKGAVHRCLHSIAHLIEDHAKAADIPIKFAASKVVEGDHLIIDKLDLDQNEKEIVEHIILQLERERELDPSASIADMRYSFIQKVCRRCVKKPKKSLGSIRSEKIDTLLTGKWTAIPIFIIIMGLVFYLTFDVIGGNLQSLLEYGIDSLREVTDAFFIKANVNEILRDLVVDGIFVGVGSVISFLPIVVSLFFFLSLLEDSGYIARVAFFMDKLLRKIGLSGRSIVPMLIGFGCTVPAVMSTSTLPSERDRKMTILLTPFMSCTAKLPVYAFLIACFFPKYGGPIMLAIYLGDIFIGILVALLFKNVIFKGEAVPFVMELPEYRMPMMKNVLQLLWKSAKDFLEKAFTIIFIGSIIIWLLQSFDVQFNLIENQQDSLLAIIAGFLTPVMRPIGLGDWRVCTALISGVMAKESVVATLEVLYGTDLFMAMNLASAASLIVFSALYTPCVAAIAAIRRELGNKWAYGVIIWQSFLAWIVSFVVYHIVNLL